MKQLKTSYLIYSQLLKLYPKAYWQRYEQEILQTTTDMLNDANGPLAKAVVWLQLAIDLPINIFRQQLVYLGGSMQHEMPAYVKRNGLIASVMLLPFFAALGANGLDKIINNHTLLNSWVWHAPALNIWVIWLPTLAFLLAIISYLTFAIKNNHQKSLLKRLIDIRHSWPVVLPLLVAIFIMLVLVFHDSVQCLMHSPIYTVQHFNKVWQCTSQGRAFNTWHIVKRAFF